MKTNSTFDALADFDRFNLAMDRLFGKPLPAMITGPASIPLDIYDADGKFVVRASIPGVDPAQLDVQLNEGILTIRGEVSREETSESAKVYRREIATGSFSRSIRLPENLDLDTVDAAFSNGVVTITITHQVEVKPEPKRITVRQQALGN